MRPDWTALEWMAVFSTIFTIFFLGRWMRGWFTAGETLAIMATYAFSPLVARFSGIIMPVPFFGLASVVCFYLLEKQLVKPTPGKALWLGFILGWGSLMRPDGIVLLIGIIGPFIFLRDKKPLLHFILIPVLGWVVFVALWFRFRYVSHTEYGGDLQALLKYWTSNFSGIFSFVVRWFKSFLLANWRSVKFYNVGQSLYFSAITFTIFLVGVIHGFIRLWKLHKSKRIILLGLAFFLGSFFLIHIFWHVALARYFCLFIPFSVIFIASSANRKLWGKLLLFVILSSYAYENSMSIYRTYWVPNPMNAPPWNCFDWISKNTTPSTKFISNIAPSIDLYTGRPASPVLNATNVDFLHYLLIVKEFDYVVLRDGVATTPGVGSTENLNIFWDRYRRWMRNYPERFKLVFSDGAERTAIYQVVKNENFKNSYKIFIEAAQLSEQKNYENAFFKTLESLKLEPQLGCAVNLLGALYLLQNRFELAEQSFIKANQLLPDSTNGLVNLATLKGRQGQIPEALDFLRKSVDLNNKNGDEPEFSAKVEDIKKHLYDGGGTIFIDLPHPSFYSKPANP